MKAITCPQCGGLIQEIAENRTIADCEYCGAKILVPFEKKPLPSAVSTARPGFNAFGYPVDDEVPFTTPAEENNNLAGKVTGFMSAAVLLIAAIGIFVAFTSKSRSQANSAAPTAYRTPTPRPTPPRIGVDKDIQSRAVSLPKAVLPKGTVIVSQIKVEVFVKIDEKGNVALAQAYTGTEVLKTAAEQAAKQAKFKPTEKEISGILVYEFSPN
ncbi:MAG TPA: hypothetical protein VF599_16260 [Pyrinomonadaceae bacterium]|jgi:DNA-directed RNA polymerase subunit RPC12/RpoP